MTAQLSRRGLFRAFRLPAHDLPAGRSPDADVDAKIVDAKIVDAIIARIGDGCVEPRGVMCRRCGDECDVRAISFRLLGAGRSRPSLDGDLCTGCSACVDVCPVKAIEMIPAERVALAAGLAELGRAS